MESPIARIGKQSSCSVIEELGALEAAAEKPGGVSGKDCHHNDNNAPSNWGVEVYVILKDG